MKWRLLLLGLCSAVIWFLGGSVVSQSALAQGDPDVEIFAPGYFATSALDESIRFSWFAENSQDFFAVFFSQSRSFGWETTPYVSRQTVLSSIYLTPEEVGLAPGTWYWRICFGWNDDPGSCYFDDDVRSLEVEEPEPFLSLASARAVARRYVRRNWGIRARARCARMADSRALCRVSWRRFGRLRARYLRLRLDQDGYVYVSRPR
jgi:hypothetical protein